MIEHIHNAALSSSISPAIPASIISGIYGVLGGSYAVWSTGNDLKIRRREFFFSISAILMTAVLAGVVKAEAMYFAGSAWFILAYMMQHVTLVAFGWAVAKLSIARANDSENRSPLLYVVGLFPYLAITYAFRRSVESAKGLSLRRSMWRNYIYMLVVMLPVTISASVVQFGASLRSEQAAEESLWRIAEVMIAKDGADAYAQTVVQMINASGRQAEIKPGLLVVFISGTDGTEFFSRKGLAAIEERICQDPTYGPYLSAEGAMSVEMRGVGDNADSFHRIPPSLCRG